jgi:NADPH-dependent ferric siderophore reductase
MSDPGPRPAPRVRRPPPPFRHVVVRRTERLSPRMIRVTFTGGDLAGMVVEHPAASVRLLLPQPGTDTLVIPVWQGNEFLLPDGQRPTLRTFTPRLVAPDTHEIDLDVVLHAGGAASDWAAAAAPGDPAAISGPGRGYVVDPDAPAFVLGGDEAAIPAISQLVAAIPSRLAVQVHIELAHPQGRLDLPPHPGVVLQWHDLPPGAAAGQMLVRALATTAVAPGARIWFAGEAASMQRLRRVLFEERGIPRTQASVRGYWKMGRRGDAAEDT